MTVADCLGFVCFASFRCNGTSVLAEIHRVVLLDIDLYREKARRYTHFYDFLFETAKELFPDVSVGSCTENRFNFNAKGNEGTTHWPKHEKELLWILKAIHSNKSNLKTKNALDKTMRQIYDEIGGYKGSGKSRIKRFLGAGPMTTPTFVDLCGLVGLLPLYAYTYAEVRGKELGPAGLVKVCYGAKEMKNKKGEDYHNIFKKLHNDVVKVWGTMVTMAILENMMCELLRNYNKTVQAMKLKKKEPTPSIEVITQQDKAVDSGVNDCYYFNECRNQIQNLYSIRISGKDASHLRPVLVMKISSRWNDGTKSKLSLTNWCQNNDDERHLMWEHYGSDMTLDTKLHVSEEIEDIFAVSNDGN